MEAGRAVFENDNYSISVGNEGSVNIRNKASGESYEIGGEPYLHFEGQHTFNFHGTTTLSLEDGTKVTLDTRPARDEPGSAQTSRVTITNGDYGVQIGGVDSGGTGHLTVDETKHWGGLLDAVVADGNVLQENPAGFGLLAVDEKGKIHAVDQTYIDGSELRGAGEHLSPLAQAFEALSTLISICLSGCFEHAGGGHAAASPVFADNGPGTFRPEVERPVDTTASTRAEADQRAVGHPIFEDPLGVGSKQNQADHDPVEHALDPLGLF
jgi:hypothetical protein